MLIDKFIPIELSYANKKHYRELGYDFSDESVKNNDILMVKQIDVPHSSNNVKLEFVCDFCGKPYEKFANNYYRDRKITGLDNCSDKDCKKAKKDIKNIKLYGTTNKGEIAKIVGHNLGRRKKYNLDDLIQMANKKDYTILSEHKENITVKGKILLKCNKHEIEFETSISCFMNELSDNCPACFAEKASERYRECSIKDVQKICDEKDYTLLTDFIANCDDDVYYICNVHPEYGIQKTSLWGLQHYSHNCKLCHQPRGENHFNWQGGIANDRERDNDSFEYRRWRESVFRRDDYTCQCCGKKGGRLNAHHIKNYATNENLRYDSNNGITLCEECHLINYPNAFHKIYGNYNNTPEQLQEYLDTYREKFGLPKKQLEEIINNIND